VGAIDLAHAAGADAGGDFVDAKAGAGGEWQVADYTGRTVVRAGLLAINDRTLSGVTRRTDAEAGHRGRPPGHFR
jgi:hypothetical protein